MVLETNEYQLLLSKIAERMSEQQLKLVVAESCSGGWIAKACTDLPESSAWFAGSLVTYSDEMKSKWLGIDQQLLHREGAVSQIVVEAMTNNALLKTPSADIAIAVSGIAGPGGATPTKPVGTVWIAWQRRHQVATTRQFHFNGNRAAVRSATVLQALEGLEHLLR